MRAVECNTIAIRDTRYRTAASERQLGGLERDAMRHDLLHHARTSACPRTWSLVRFERESAHHDGAVMRCRRYAAAEVLERRS